MGLAPLDRRVVVTDGDGNAKRGPLSGLHGCPFVILVGEPGIGKSSALAFEAAVERGQVLTCREPISDPGLAAEPAAEVLRLMVGEMCIYLLLSGTKALWRSNALPGNPVELVSGRELPLVPESYHVHRFRPLTRSPGLRRARYLRPSALPDL
jgi:hypothetical protein